MPGRDGCRREAARPGGRWFWRGVVVLAAALLAGSGCTADTEPDDSGPPSSPTPAPTVAATTPVPASTAEVDVPVEFAFEVPDPLCPPASAMDSFPLAAEHPYAVSHSRLTEFDSRFTTSCVWRREDNQEHQLGLILEDHVNVGVLTYAYRDWSERWLPGALTFPVWSDDLEDWFSMAMDAAGLFRERVSWEGCGRATECADGEEPTVQLHRSQFTVQGRVANLLFDVTINYHAEELPEDVEMRTIAILRDVVLATVDGFERIE